MAHPHTDFWLYDIMARRAALHTPGLVTARSIPGRLYLTLSDWATIDELAVAAWGDDAERWPDFWCDNLRSQLSNLRKVAGITIERQILYRIAR